MTQTIFIDADKYPTGHALHEALRRMLSLPGHYGCNADALHDCLAERAVPVNAAVMTDGAGETADALRKVLRVIEDCGGSVKRL